jgi:hypothetical protein
MRKTKTHIEIVSISLQHQQHITNYVAEQTWVCTSIWTYWSPFLFKLICFDKKHHSSFLVHALYDTIFNRKKVFLLWVFVLIAKITTMSKETANHNSKCFSYGKLTQFKTLCLGFYTSKEREAEVIWCSNRFQTLMNCNVYAFIWTDLKLLLDCDGVSHTLMDCENRVLSEMENLQIG